MNPGMPVIMITGYASVEDAVRSIKIGAFDYVQKPVKLAKLQRVIENALNVARLQKENEHLRNRLSDAALPIVSQDPRMLQTLAQLGRLADTDIPILLCGESGTGKELFADFVHLRSRRAAYKLYKLNCASLPQSLLDNELFGHDKGAYTGADSVFKGIFERAHQSSLFLDEIGDMPLEIRSKILRTLQNREVRRLGGTQTLVVDVRFIAATNHDVEVLVEARRLREDLYYRLNAATFTIPPLRDRKGDIPLLTSHFLTEFARNNGGRLKSVDASVNWVLASHNWPGNGRELKNVVNYGATIAGGALIRAQHLPPYLTRHKTAARTSAGRVASEKERIIDALAKSKYNKKLAAELLRISRRTLYNKLAKYEISP